MLTEELRLDGTVRRLRYDWTGFLIRETLRGTEGGELSTGLARDKTGRLVLKTQADQRTGYDHRAGELHIRYTGQQAYKQALAEGRQPDYQTLSFFTDTPG